MNREQQNPGQQPERNPMKAGGQNQASNAQPLTVSALPATGLVKVSGTVDSVSNEKKFTLKDSTGNVDVNIKSERSASLNKGNKVAVIGYVNKGLLGKSINATNVEVQSVTQQ